MDLWTTISKNLNQWTSPLRPCSEDVQLYQKHLSSDGRVLLLGATPELQPLATVAIDNNPHVFEALTEGISLQTVVGDWANLPFEDEFDAIIGDGCLTVFQGSQEHFFAQMKKALKKNGLLTMRVFIAPEHPERLEDVLPFKNKMGFHAYKWRVAHTLASPYIHVQDIYKTIYPVYDHPTLETYKNSNIIYYFPKLSQLPQWDDIEFPISYELSDRCPVITWSKNAFL